MEPEMEPRYTNYGQTRRDFLVLASSLGLGFCAPSISLSALVERNPQEAYNRATAEFRKVRTSESASKLLDYATRTSVPLDRIAAEDIIARDFLLRWQLTHSLTLLDQEQINRFIKEEPAISLDLPASGRLDLARALTSFDVSVVPNLSDITPLQLKPMPSGARGEKKEPCAIVILELVLTAIVRVTIAEEALDALKSLFKESLRCLEAVVKARNWEALPGCLYNFVLSLVAPAVWSEMEKLLGRQAVRRLLKFATTRLVPFAGAIFFVVTLTLLIKDNWLRLDQSCGAG